MGLVVAGTLSDYRDAGKSRTCQAAIEDLSETFLELDESDVPGVMARSRHQLRAATTP
jgi:hypothetical protein